ncbi:MAG: TIGR02206 family membrane protein [Cyanobacteria bacterium J06648_16]
MFQASLHPFRLFSLTHITIVISFVLVWLNIIRFAENKRETGQLIRLERGFAGVCLFLWTAFHSWWLLPVNFDLATSLPLHLCDLAALFMALALLSKQRWLISLTYFWGLSFSAQGLLTPDLQLRLSSPLFWLFWLHHATLVGTAVYFVVVYKFRPSLKDYWDAVSASLLYLVCIFPLNALFGSNYGYLGPSLPAQPSILQWLGPWPWRVVLIAILAWLGMTLLLLPWEWRRRHIRA